MGEEVEGRPVIEASGIDPDAGDLAAGDEPLGGVLADAWEVQVRGIAGDIAAHVLLLVGPEPAPADHCSRRVTAPRAGARSRPRSNHATTAR